MKITTLIRTAIAIPMVLFAFNSVFAQKKPIIGVAGIAHESNSFSSQLTTLDLFDFKLGETQKELSEKFFSYANSQTISSGYIEGSKRFGLELYPTVVTRARPMGPVTDNAFDTMMGEIIKQLKAGPELDGILLNLHGAMVVESYPSGDEEIVRRVRKAFGPKMPIIVTHDFHANVTPELVKLSNVLITFKENPHLDTFDRGLQAAKIMAEMVKEGVKPTQAIVKAPMVYNIVYQSTFANPLLPITTASKELEKNEKVLAVSVSGGYQYADVPWMGPSVIVVTDNDPELAQKEAQRLSDMLWDSRDKTILDSPQPAEAVKMAMEHDGRPVVLIDMGDNIGGGSTGDSSFLLEELIKQGAQGWVMVIADPDAYKIAENAGVGNDFDFEVGGKTDDMHGKPVRIKGQVRSLNVGRYLETEVRHGGGRYWNMGHTAVIQVEGSTLDEPNLLLLTTLASSPNSAHQLISNGVYVERQKIIVAKGNIAPRAAYEPFASLLIQVDSPGSTAVNPSWFKFKRARKGMFGMGDY
ncbi:M81 family metallopeptidase [uncultured Cyclobacterium sp.]|uniref:M81 family metallopeptidase n=1 Tax=uncultured Cyclobacterium sp. TaxID=453820 RepID=UPI0030EC9FC9|tara:strand:+ start:134178 stop:135755 length:1578 start_codon:yes stop_codon:yes gene_type:complete